MPAPRAVERYPLPFLPDRWPEPAKAFYAGRVAMLLGSGAARPDAQRRAEEATRRWWALGKGGVPPAWPGSVPRSCPKGEEEGAR